MYRNVFLVFFPDTIYTIAAIIFSCCYQIKTVNQHNYIIKTSELKNLNSTDKKAQTSSHTVLSPTDETQARPSSSTNPKPQKTAIQNSLNIKVLLNEALIKLQNLINKHSDDDFKQIIPKKKLEELKEKLENQNACIRLETSLGILNDTPEPKKEVSQTNNQINKEEITKLLRTLNDIDSKLREIALAHVNNENLQQFKQEIQNLKIKIKLKKEEIEKLKEIEETKTQKLEILKCVQEKTNEQKLYQEIESLTTQVESFTNLYLKLKELTKGISEQKINHILFDNCRCILFNFEIAVQKKEDLEEYYALLDDSEKITFKDFESAIKNKNKLEAQLKEKKENLEMLSKKIEEIEETEDHSNEITQIEKDLENLKKIIENEEKETNLLNEQLESKEQNLEKLKKDQKEKDEITQQQIKNSFKQQLQACLNDLQQHSLPVSAPQKPNQ